MRREASETVRRPKRLRLRLLLSIQPTSPRDEEATEEATAEAALGWCLEPEALEAVALQRGTTFLEIRLVSAGGKWSA